MADNITYRFIQNVGDYFPSGYFTDDFINKVQSCAGYSADDMKALCSPYVQIRGEYEEYKNFIINANARKEDEIKHTHDWHTMLLKKLGYDTKNAYQEPYVVKEGGPDAPTEIIPVRHIIRSGDQISMLIMEMQNLITVNDTEPDGLFKQQYEDERASNEQRYYAGQWRQVIPSRFLDREKYRFSPAIINKAITQIFLMPEDSRPHYILMLAGNTVFLFDQEKWARGSYLQLSLDELYFQAQIKNYRLHYALFHLLCCKYTFFWFENEIKTKGVKTIWEEIQKNFLQIKEWYSDNLLYHKIGYLISSRTMNMMDIFKKAQGCRKSVFLNELDKMIAESINFQLKDENTYRDLNYEKNYKEISNLLLLFNIESIIKEQVYQRFPFSKYNTAEWSLEHIHAQNSQGLKKKETQIEWVKMHLESIISVNDKGQYDEIIAEMKNIISTNQIETRNVFDELFNKVCNALSEDSDSDYIHTLSNMALLTKNDNAALNNSTFDVKRNQIVSMDQRGAFIPYCTKMVFLKYYTPSRENQIHFWGQKDRIAYIKAMENIIQPYLTIINKTF